LLKLFFLLNLAILHPLSAQNVVTRDKANMPGTDEIDLGAVTQSDESEWKYLKGAAFVHTTEMSISADEIDFNSDTNWTYARGHVRLEHYASGDILNADHAEYNIRTEEGKFYAVQGTSPSKILTSPGVLTTTNPFYFQALWADRIKNRYILHKGFITDCKMPKPWWKFTSPQFDVVPGEHAIARHALLIVQHVPVLYLPYFFRPLGRNPRASGFLTPTFGNTTRFGYMYGGGYYWAINRSYDATYAIQELTLRGQTHTFDFRGKPNDVSDFNFSLYKVDDNGVPGSVAPKGGLISEGGTDFELTGKTQILGFTAKIDYNYLSSYLFREAFASAYSNALNSEVRSIGYMQRHFNDDLYSLNFVFNRDQLYESVTYLFQPKNDVIIQTLPAVQFLGREQQVNKSDSLPIFFSFVSSAALETRQESDNTSSGLINLNSDAMSRVDVEPRLSSYFKIGGFSFDPSITVGLTDYGKDYSSNSTTFYTPPSVITPGRNPVYGCGGYPACPPQVVAYDVAIQTRNLLRHDADFVLKMSAPTIERIFVPPAWLHMGEKLKHVVEFNATYEDVSGISGVSATGVSEVNRIIRLDSTDILSDTNQITFDVTNRLYKKGKNGVVSELLNWHLSYARYFDPTFGGAVVAGERNVILEALEMSAYTYFYQPRNYSPIESSLIVTPVPFLSFEYRSAYDPLQHKFIDHLFSTTIRRAKYSFTVSDTAITSKPLLVPSADQITLGAAYGTSIRRGWNVGGMVTFDLLLNRALFEFGQVTYNTDCCGFSFEIRRFNSYSIVPSQDQYLFSFTLANLGTFGSMQKQDRVF
jgi:LPS-assembly protein